MKEWSEIWVLLTISVCVSCKLLYGFRLFNIILENKSFLFYFTNHYDLKTYYTLLVYTLTRIHFNLG